MIESSALFSTPSFLRGIANIFDFGSNLSRYNYFDTPEEADYKALLRDFALVAYDIRCAVEEWEKENNVK